MKFFAVFCLLILAGTPAFAGVGTDFVVTKTADTNDGVCDSDCSLREAIAAANLAGGPNRVILGSSQSYTLSLGQLTVLCSLTLLRSAVTGNGGSANYGGGILVVGDASTMTVTSSALTGNDAGVGAAGGAVSVPFGTSSSTVTRSRIVSNVASTDSGI